MKKNLVLAGVVVLLPFIVYLNSLQGEFVFDDVPLISQNPRISGLHDLSSFFDLKTGTFSYRPVRTASYSVDYFLNKNFWRHLEKLIGRYEGNEWGLNPFGYHVSNLGYHLITVLLVFLLINILAGNRMVAFVAALLFSIHPVHTDSVAYISGRRDILSTLFYLLGFYCFLKYRAGVKWHWLMIFFSCYLLALGSKEMAVTLPLLCFCYDLVATLPREGVKGLGGTIKNLYGGLKKVVCTYKYFYLFYFITAASFTFYKVWVRTPSQRDSFYGESVFVNFLTVAKILVYYLRLICFPINLTADYSYNGFPLAYSLMEPGSLIALLILCFMVYGLLKLLTQFPLFSFGMIWWFITLLPVCQIFPHHELLAEHYLYLPSVGFFLCSALMIARGLETVRWRTATALLLGAVVVLFSVRTAHRNLDWENATVLWEKTVKVVPGCVRAQDNLGVCYYRQGRYREALVRHQLALSVNPEALNSYNNLGNVYVALKRYAQAEEQYRRALQIESDSAETYNNLGMLSIKTGDYEDARKNFSEALRLKQNFAAPHHGLGMVDLHYGRHASAISEFKKAIGINPSFAEAHNNLGTLYYAQGKLPEAVRELTHATRLNPDLLEAHKNLATIYRKRGKIEEAIDHYFEVLRLDQGFADAYYQLGILYRRKGEYDAAIRELKNALRIKPEWAEVHNQLGIVYKFKGDYHEAITHYNRAISLSPDYIDAYYNLALVYEAMDLDDEALGYYQRAVEYNPDFSQALNNMGNVYALRGNYEKAIQLFARAVEADPDWALAHNNLGSAYRAEGRYDDALREFKEAERLDPSYSDPHFNLAQLYLKDLQQLGNALVHYRKAIALDPAHPRTTALKKQVEILEKKLVQTPPQEE